MKLKWLKDKLGEKFYPIAHATGVVVAENKTLDSKLSEIDIEIGNKADKTEIPTELPAKGGDADTVNGHTVKSDVPENAIFTDTIYDDTELKERISQQSKEMMDIKMLGWSVPKECPIQNEVNGNQFIQKVGRADLGSYKYSYSLSDGFYIPNFDSSKYGIADNNKNYSTGYTTCTSMDDLRQSTKGLFIKGTSFNIKDTSYTDASAFKSAMQGKYLYYELATPITTTIDGNEIGETVSDMRKETTVNLFKPTLETTTQNGITVTNNGDGTYAVTGTATDTTELILGSITLTPGIYKNIGATAYIKKTDGSYVKTIRNEEFTITEDSPVVTPILFYNSSEAISGTIIIKPMITTNLNATIDDFVPYTGDTGQLNKDVAELRSDVDGLGDELVTRRIQLLANFTSDYYRYIEPVAGKNQILVPPIIVNGTSTSFDSSGGDEVSGANYSYAPRESVKMDILDVEVSSSVTQEGITVKFLDKRLDLSKLYNVTGTATSDIEIPLYSVNEPKNSYLYFVTDSVRKMSSGTFYIKISDSSGNETTLGTDGSKSLKTYLKKHNGKVTVYLVVKSGITVKQYVNVKCGYSSSDCIADFSPRKYSDTIDNVIDAILDLNNRLKALENK